ncbi:MAG: methionyl-tRNA formyltransferase [Candidatus Saelkia tenebricola]|nr:methionyl-tRNA formyltransferase [Candidatus Saelkia tenebricola]
MRIVFFGSGSFSIPALEYLFNFRQSELIAVVTQSDKKSGRGLVLKSTEVKRYIDSKGYKGEVFQPLDTGELDFVKKMAELKSDLFIVACFGQILSKELLSLPSALAINIHSSLLPKYRGAAPVNWAVINGEKTTGVTIFKMNEALDSGEIISQKICEITHEDNSVILESRLANIARDLLRDSLRLIEDKKYKLSPQTGKVSFAPKLKKQDGLIEWNLVASSILNRIRGLQPWPNAYTYMDSKLFKIYSAEVVSCEYQGVPAEVVEVDKDNIVVKCGSEALSISEVQIEGGRKMTVKEFLLGHKVKLEMQLGT